MLPAILFLCACDHDSPSSPETDSEKVPVELALSVSGSAGMATRSDEGVVTEIKDSPVFRGVSDISLYPFDTRDQVNSGSKPNWKKLTLGDISADWTDAAVSGTTYSGGLVRNNNSHLYPSSSVFLPRRTATVLVYGRAGSDAAEETVSYRKKHGAITPTLPEAPASADEVRFAPIPFYGESAVPQEGASLAAILSDILGTTYDYSATGYYDWGRYGGWQSTQIEVTASWSTDSFTYYDQNITDSDLKKLYDEIAVDASGSGASVLGTVTSLYNALKDFSSGVTGDFGYYSQRSNSSPYLPYSDVFNGLRDAIISKIENYFAASGSAVPYTLSYKDYQGVPSTALAGYPGEDYGFPDGVAKMKWDSGNQKFEAALVSSVTEGAPVNLFCYPPSLWYHTNSPLSISYRSDEAENYVSSNEKWSDILGFYDASGGSVWNDTESVAVENPLSYGQGILKVQLSKVKSSPLKDNADKDVAVNNELFPMTGIVIGGQRVQNYNFAPIAGEDYFLYDSELSGAYISSTTESQPTKTLAFQTAEKQDIYVALEFRNGSGSSFTGEDGEIAPGMKFYLVGALKYADGTGTASSVIQQGNITTVTFTVTTLAHALNTIPNLTAPQLNVGVQAEIKWKQATPGEVILY